jgi:SAM-dependent methyltransferase
MPLTSEQHSMAFPSGEKSPKKDLQAASTSEGGYDPAFFDRLALIEDEHFWFRARNRLIFKLTRKLTSSFDRGNVVLEVGCGTGNVLRVLKKACPSCMVAGIELWRDGLIHARRRSDAALVQADVQDWPFGRQADLIGMFDVLEHIPADRETLVALRERLVPGGRLLLTVPAHQSLWSYFDEAAKHCRRYSPDEIRQRLVEAGFEVEFLSQFMACIFPLVWIVRKLRGIGGRTGVTAQAQANDEFRIVPAVNWILAALLTLESAWVARGHRLPIGTSLVVVARRSKR